MRQVTHIAPDMSQSLLLQALEQLSGVDQRLGVLQGQANEIIREQQRAADGRRELYAKVNRIDAIEATVDRIAPLVDAHEKQKNRADGALSLGRTVLAMSSGAFGAAIALLAKWLTEGRPHP